jgi:superfamily II DNA or RNA helicase
MEPLTPELVCGEKARAVIAALASDNNPGSVGPGRVKLHAHQVSAVLELRRSIAEFGGALLCDPVGTGKTYTALAVASPLDMVLVVGPAILRQMWRQASSVAGRRIDFVSFESLSRRASVCGSHSLIIVDEAHHARNPRTIRYEVLSRLCTGREVVMLTATPIHNRARDLESLLGLFMGSRAAALSSAEIARCVIRRSGLSPELTAVPRADQVVWCGVREDDRIPSMLLDLPPPLPPRDGGDGGALVVHSLIRQWASSDDALIGGLRRRLARAEALIAALGDGTWPSKSELASWISGEDSVQLALTSLLAPPTRESEALLPVVRRHNAALRSVLDLAKESSADDDRASVLRELRESHRDRRIVVFSQYADTINGMFSRLSPDGYVAALTGAGGRVAGGEISRHEVIRRFAPLASGVSRPRRAHDVTLLLTTDLLSEGVNLQDAGVVVHFDLPWTPARLEQRLGRLTRLGSSHERVISYAFKPPASSETIIRVETILRRKLEDTGVVTEMLPSFGEWSSGTSTARNSPLGAEALRRVIQGWTTKIDPDLISRPVIAVIDSPETGFLAAVKIGGGLRLIGCLGDHTGDDFTLLLKCAELCIGADAVTPDREIAFARKLLDDWLKSESALAGTRLSSAVSSSARNKTVRRIDRIVRSARPYERSRIQEKARHARMAIEQNFGAHAERELYSLCSGSDGGEPWLERVIAFCNTMLRDDGFRPDQELRVAAMIVFRKTLRQ